jgi:hypothetical protein
MEFWRRLFLNMDGAHYNSSAVIGKNADQRGIQVVARSLKDSKKKVQLVPPRCKRGQKEKTFIWI